MHGLVVREWVLEGWWCVHGSYRSGGTCMGPGGGGTCMCWCMCIGRTGVVIRAWVLGVVVHAWVGGTCIGPRGVVVHA